MSPRLFPITAAGSPIYLPWENTRKGAAFGLRNHQGCEVFQRTRFMARSAWLADGICQIEKVWPLRRKTWNINDKLSSYCPVETALSVLALQVEVLQVACRLNRPSLQTRTCCGNVTGTDANPLLSPSTAARHYVPSPLWSVVLLHAAVNSAICTAGDEKMDLYWARSNSPWLSLYLVRPSCG